MSRKEISLEIYQGENWELRVEYKDPETGEPIPLTGFNSKLQIKNQANTITYATLDSNGETDGPVTVNEEGGYIDYVLPPSVTSGLDWDGLAKYDVFTFNGNTIEESTESMVEVFGSMKLFRRVTN